MLARVSLIVWFRLVSLIRDVDSLANRPKQPRCINGDNRFMLNLPYLQLARLNTLHPADGSAIPSTRLGRYHFAMLLTLALLLLTIAVAPGRISAHAELDRSSPAADAVLAAPPQRIELWLTESVASGAGSPAISVLDETGEGLTVSDVTVDPDNPLHVTANVDGVGFGTFTVAWTTRSEVDGHTLSGTYAFRVGGTNRAPGAATVEGETPRAWAVATRWITFLAAALAASGFLFARFVSTDASGARRRYGLMAGAAAVGIASTVLEPVLQSQFPPSGTTAPAFGDALNGLPDAWSLRIPGLILAMLVAIWVLSWRDRTPGTAVVVAGAAGGLIAILGLALTSHASARETWRIPAIASVIVHQWSVALWAGGLVHLLISRRSASEMTPLPLFKRFSFWALSLAITGIATGVVNAGLVLPGLTSLWESDYGRVLIFKVVVLLPVLGLAAYHRLTLRRAVDRVAGAFRMTLRLETLLILLVVLGGSVIALLAPPITAKSTIGAVDLAAEIPGASQSASDAKYVRFRITPADQGENEIAVAVTTTIPVSFGPNGTLVDAPPLLDIALLRVTLTNLQDGVAPISIDLTADPEGWFRSGKLQIGLGGWWRVDALVRQIGKEDVTVPFYLLIPDPNVNGESAVRVPETTDEARAMFEAGLTGLTSLTSVHFTERLSGGTGTTVLSDHITHAETAEGPAAMQISTSDSEVIRTGGLQWIRDGDSPWSRTDAGPVVSPSEWGSDYVNATGLKLGNLETIDGRTAQIISFYVPDDRFAAAWYSWWVDTESGHILRETMVSRGHYMVRDFDSFDAAPPIVPPDDES